MTTEIKLLNVSYDPTRELYSDFNAAFARHWKEKTGDTVVIPQSHGGSGKQARSVIDGLRADVVTLALAYDIDTGACGSSTTFAQRGIGDVFLSWENEAHLLLKELGTHKLELVMPSLSILAEPPVAVVEKVARKQGNETVARAYLEYLYSDEGQDIAGKHFYRPRSEQAAAKYAAQFAPVKLVTIDEVFGGWQKAQKTHFADGGFFDQIFKP